MWRSWGSRTGSAPCFLAWTGYSLWAALAVELSYVCLSLSFVCNNKMCWERFSQTVSCARQCVVIAIEWLCVSVYSHSLSAFSSFLFQKTVDSGTRAQSSSLLTILGKVLAKQRKEQMPDVCGICRACWTKSFSLLLFWRILQNLRTVVKMSK